MDKEINHFKKVAETVKEIRRVRAIEKHNELVKMDWQRKLAIQKMTRGNPFEDRMVNPHVVTSKI